MKQWVKVAEEREFEQYDRKLTEPVEGLLVGLFKVGSAYYAVEAWCSHERALLTHGELEGTQIECPLHGARFDLRTGRHLTPPAVRPIRRFPVRVRDGHIEIEVDLP